MAVEPVPMKTEESSCYRHHMSDGQWHRTLSHLRNSLKNSNWAYCRTLAGAIQEKIAWLDPIMHRYCSLTCRECDDPCCQATKIYFNRADMLYLTVLDREPPPGQTRTEESARCRYLTPNGCSLARAVRPYVCVWFICDAHMTLFQQESGVCQRRFIGNLAEIRQHRLALESLYAQAALP